MRLRIAEGQEIGRVFTLKAEGFGIGRGHDNDLVLPEEGVSRRHCRICQAGGAWLVEDLNSTNGVSVNGTRIEGTRAIAPGDRIGVGKHVMIVEDGEAGSPAGAPGAPVAAPLPSSPPVTEVEAAAAQPAGDRAEPLWDDSDLPPRRRLPWVRLVLLAVILGAIAVLAFLLFSGGGSKPAESSGETATAAASTPDQPPREVSDKELAKLIADEEKAPRPAGDAVTPPATAEAAAKPPPAGTATAPAAPEEGETPVTETGRAVVSDLVFVASEPSGALVVVDGKEQGTAPLLVRGLEKGRHRIQLKLDGYEDFERQIHVPDLLPARPYALRAKPGTVFVASTVAGTAVWRGPQFLGVAPVLIQGLSAGEHDLVFAAPGCEPVRKQITVSEVSGERVDVDPKPQLGTLEVVTQPPGCTVSIQNALKGVSQPAAEGALVSAPLRFSGLRGGTYPVLVEHPSGVSLAGKLTVKPGESVSQTVRLWVPDTRLVLNDGTVKVGMLMERNEQGDVVLAESARQLERYLKPLIANTVPLTKEETTEILKKQGLLAPARPDVKADEKPEGKTEGKGEGKEKSREGGERRGTDAKAGVEEPIPWGDEPATATARNEAAGAQGKHEGDSLSFTADDLSELLRSQSSMEVTHRFKDKTVTVRGKPSGVGKEGANGFVSFGRRIRCYLDRGFYDEQKDKLRESAEGDGLLAVTGVSAGVRGDVLILRDCKAKEITEEPKK